MKILFVLTYYRPHISGLTIYVERLARALAARGHEVTILTSRYANDLPAAETMDGVRVVRAPVWLRIGKGVLMPTFAWWAIDLIRKHDVVSVQLPQLESSVLAMVGRVLVRRPVILTYHCDLRLPVGFLNHCAERVVFLNHVMAGFLADRIVAYTRDYAEHSHLLSRFVSKIEVIQPPVVLPPAPPVARPLLQQLNLDGRPVVGFAARLATEKGAEYLLEALDYLLPRLPNVHVLFAGDHTNVLGEKAYARRLQPMLARHRDHVTLLGVLHPQQMADFYEACDVLVLPSINSTESFGLVQVEAMLCGTPVVASDLPGVRQPVQLTGMGEIVPPRDAPALAEAMLKVLRHPELYIKPRAEIARTFDVQRTVSEYERLFQQSIQQTSGKFVVGAAQSTPLRMRRPPPRDPDSAHLDYPRAGAHPLLDVVFRLRRFVDRRWQRVVNRH